MIRYIFITVASLIFALLLSGWNVYAQTTAIDQRKAVLERELALLEAQIAGQQVLLDGKQRERVSLERDVAILEAKIQKARLSIRARDIAIQQLNGGISDKEQTIEGLIVKIEREKESLAQLIRRTNEIDSYSLVEVVLSNKDVSAFFEDLDAFASIKEALNESFIVIETVKQSTHNEKLSLEEKRAEELELKQLQEMEKNKVEVQEGEKQRILTSTKGEEKAYQQQIKEKQKTAAEIRAALFSLRGTAAIPFGEALRLAEHASSLTGVRPAFILGIVAEESNLGENVGTGNWLTDMHPERDRPVFEQITKRLGLDPNTMPVSKKPWYGWGGAMGPAQFIPSTWILYEEKIAKLTGHNPPNPWNPEDAFVASAVLLQDNGATRGGYANERLAALRYFAGWKNAEKPQYAFYGDDVMDLAEKYQKQIDILKGV